MRFRSLSVDNFRAIKHATLTDLPGMVVIAGPNGCGKSCLFDAIRLVKSVYGGYQPNEWQHWFSEFQINLDRRQPELLTLMQDRSRPVTISIEVMLEAVETAYIKTHVKELLRPIVWYQVAPEAGYQRRSAPLAAQMRQFGPEISRKVDAEAEALLADMEAPVHKGEITIHPDLSIQVSQSPTLQLVFSVFEPQQIGIVEYHGAQRTYQREQVGSVNLSIETNEQQTSQQALYNYAAKFTNIKAEMASGYIRDLIGKEVGAEGLISGSLTETLKELFETFFPGKHFHGPHPTPDGRLLFPVTTEDGFEHDINDLSSGEKEVLYGYLRLHNLSPRNSVILIDEPELHLNPRLIQGLPQFYDRHLGSPLGNQIWLLTHSDALLREALAGPDFSVFHMQLPTFTDATANQTIRVRVDEEIDSAIVDLVGDLATYRPGAKVVILEGGGDSDFDLFMVNTLFPEFQNKVNAISGGNKARVLQLNEVLQNAKQKGAVTASFFAIVDHDTDEPTLTKTDGVFRWPSYHIENYLLEPAFILEALRDVLANKCPFSSSHDVETALASSAAEVFPSLVREHLEQHANRELVAQIRTRADSAKGDLVAGVRAAIDASLERLSQTSAVVLAEKELNAMRAEVEQRLNADLASGNWRTTFRGRDVLRRFVGKYIGTVKYEYFRNVVIAKMRDASHQPAEMKDIIAQILAG
jgi:predicted ATPase